MRRVIEASGLGLLLSSVLGVLVAGGCSTSNADGTDSSTHWTYCRTTKDCIGAGASECRKGRCVDLAASSGDSGVPEERLERVHGNRRRAGRELRGNQRRAGHRAGAVRRMSVRARPLAPRLRAQLTGATPDRQREGADRSRPTRGALTRAPTERRRARSRPVFAARIARSRTRRAAAFVESRGPVTRSRSTSRTWTTGSPRSAAMARARRASRWTDPTRRSASRDSAS